MNKQEKLILFKTLKDLMIVNRGKLPLRIGSISDLDKIINKLEKRKR